MTKDNPTTTTNDQQKILRTVQEQQETSVTAVTSNDDDLDYYYDTLAMFDDTDDTSDINNFLSNTMINANDWFTNDEPEQVDHEYDFQIGRPDPSIIYTAGVD